MNVVQSDGYKALSVYADMKSAGFDDASEICGPQVFTLISNCKMASDTREMYLSMTVRYDIY